MNFKILLIAISLVLTQGLWGSEGKKMGKVSKGAWAKTSTADHSKFKELDKEFDYAPDVTEACLECHTEAGKHIMKTFHWNWGVVINGKKIGKAEGMMNNFCITAAGNEPRCTSCHIGYGFKDKSFDFTDETAIDCLVCHDTTGTYKKFPTSAGHPNLEDRKFGGKIKKAVNLKYVAQNVGAPQRHNCLSCHANGGGGNGVKHGDTDTSLINPNHALDVHMDADGLNFSCQDCHTASQHKIAGNYYDRVAFKDFEKNMGRRKREGETLSCEGCHGNKPHGIWRLDNHTDKVACTTCHIPYSARGGIPTKMSWDWSAGGLNTDGKPLKDFGGRPMKKEGHPMDMKTGKPDTSKHIHLYQAKKGAFTYAINMKPEYRWYKGDLKQITFDTVIDPDKVVDINAPTGDYNDKLAKIWPFKVHRGKQPYDIEYKKLVAPVVFGRKGSGAFWADFDWAKAIDKGMKYNNFEYSGKFGFVSTASYWPQKHMVAPEEQALNCNDCHVKNGRLEGLDGFYLVGRDGNKWLDILGLLMILGSLGGVLGHGFLRFINKNNKQD